MILYLPIAPPAAGKSTLAGLMVDAGEISHDAVVCPDTFRRVLTGDTNNQEANGLVFQMVDQVVQSRLACGLDVFLDATNLNGKGRRDMIDIARKHGSQIMAITWDVTLEECLSQNAARSRVVRPDVVERMYESYTYTMEGIQHEAYDAVCTADWMMGECERNIEGLHYPRGDPYPLAPSQRDEASTFYWIDLYGNRREGRR